MFSNKAYSYLKKLKKIEHLFLNQDTELRPFSSNGYPGGLIYLNKNIPTIIVPDLHARIYFLKSILQFKINGISVENLLNKNDIQIVCVGDGFHGERRVRERWLNAANEYSEGFTTHVNIDLEMSESLGLMELVIDLKLKYPKNFHFLKGNHENVLNEEVDGNYPFGKFTSEGKIVKEWLSKFYGMEFLNAYARFEKYLPLFAIGKDFLISHAEPQKLYTFDELVNYRDHANVIYGLTWTRDKQAERGSVQNMLETYIDSLYLDKALYFTGHKSITGLYNLRAEGKLVQIHNPDNCNILLIPAKGDIILNNVIKNII